MLTEHGVRAELSRSRSDESSQSVVWVPAQDYARAVDLIAQTTTTAPSPCDVCPEENTGRFDICWSCEEQ